MFFRKQKAVGNDNEPALPALTQIGADTSIDGNIETSGDLHVEGTVRGILRAGSCVIAAGGSVEGEILAVEVIVQGRMSGPIKATHVHLLDGAIVEGDIASETIAIDTGARLSGSVWQTGRREVPPLVSQERSAGAPPLFGDTAWDARQEEAYRPLKAVRPRLFNFGSAR